MGVEQIVKHLQLAGEDNTFELSQLKKGANGLEMRNTWVRQYKISRSKNTEIIDLFWHITSEEKEKQEEKERTKGTYRPA